MKHIFLSLILLFSLSAHSQITQVTNNNTQDGLIGKFDNGTRIVKLFAQPQSDSIFTYILAYRDETYQTLTSFEAINFYGNKDALQIFYDNLSKGFALPKNGQLTFSAGDKEVRVYHAKGFSNDIYVFCGNSNFSVNRKQLDRVFNKG